jgi:ribosomal protein S18 acetylase RimI-like enzyme
MILHRMASKFLESQKREWTKDGYLISTDWALIPIKELNAAFASTEFYWANPLPDAVMEETLRNSLCFGLFEKNSDSAVQNGQPSDTKTSVENELAESDPSPTSAATTVVKSPLQFVGIARCVTDFTTFLYLTDVWIDPRHQGKGLGKWLVGCVQDVIETMPYLRRSMLFTADWDRSVPFYEKFMDMTLINNSNRGDGLAVMERKGRGHPNFGGKGNAY